MANGGESAQGWSLWWDGVGATSTAIAGIVDFDLPSDEGVKVDVTGLESDVVEDNFHVDLKTLPEQTININSKSTSAQHIAIMNDAGSGTVRAFVAKNGAGTPHSVASFSATIQKHDLKINAKDAIRGTFTIKRTTALTFSQDT